MYICEESLGFDNYKLGYLAGFMVKIDNHESNFSLCIMKNEKHTKNLHTKEKSML